MACSPWLVEHFCAGKLLALCYPYFNAAEE
jgi:hypothetical protein